MVRLRICAFLCVLLLTALSAVAQVPDLRHAALTRIASRLQVAQREEGFSGVVLIARGDSICFHKAYGWADPFRQIPADTGRAFMIASLSKAFTAACILQLEARGLLSLEDKIGIYLPEYPAWAGRNITIHQLLCHSSGIPDYINDYRVRFWLQEKRHWAPEQTQLIGSFQNKALYFKPGTQFRYSNSGYVLLGQIVERVSGMPFEQYLRHHILNPLGMSRSGSGDFSQVTFAARAYDDEKEQRNKIQNLPKEVIFGMGGMYATAGDLFRWVRGLRNGVILPDSSVRKMWTSYISDYGYGWYVMEDHGDTLINHGGYFPGWNSYIYHFRNADLTFVMLSNYELNDPQAMLDEFSGIWFRNTESLRAEQVVPDEVKPGTGNQGYSGRYWCEGGGPGGLVYRGPVMLRDNRGKLTITPLKGEKVELLPLTKYQWRNPTQAIQAELRTDEGRDVFQIRAGERMAILRRM